MKGKTSFCKLEGGFSLKKKRESCHGTYRGNENCSLCKWKGDFPLTVTCYDILLLRVNMRFRLMEGSSSPWNLSLTSFSSFHVSYPSRWEMVRNSILRGCLVDDSFCDELLLHLYWNY